MQIARSSSVPRSAVRRRLRGKSAPAEDQFDNALSADPPKIRRQTAKRGKVAHAILDDSCKNKHMTKTNKGFVCTVDPRVLALTNSTSPEASVGLCVVVLVIYFSRTKLVV